MVYADFIARCLPTLVFGADEYTSSSTNIPDMQI